jgi:hypothetical protein
VERVAEIGGQFILLRRVWDMGRGGLNPAKYRQDYPRQVVRLMTSVFHWRGDFQQRPRKLAHERSVLMLA